MTGLRVTVNQHLDFDQRRASSGSEASSVSVNSGTEFTHADESEHDVGVMDDDCGPTPEQRLQLSQAIEREIIPRLLVVHNSMAGRLSGLADREEVEVSRDDVETFARLTANDDFTLGLTYVDALLERGLPIERLFLDLLAPAARHLGDLWKQDRCSFTEVTIGLSCLQNMLRKFGPTFVDEPGAAVHGRRALFVTAPGERHTFGLFMVAEFFRRDGWLVWDQPADELADIVHMVQCEEYEVLGVSVSGETCFPTLPESIHQIRIASANPSIMIMVGGSLFLDDPNLAADIGADTTAIDGVDAVRKANEFVYAMTRPC